MYIWYSVYIWGLSLVSTQIKLNCEFTVKLICYCLKLWLSSSLV